MESPTIPAPTTTTSWWEAGAWAEAEALDRRAGSGRRRRGPRMEKRWPREDGEAEGNGAALGLGAGEKAKASIGSGDGRRSGEGTAEEEELWM